MPKIKLTGSFTPPWERFDSGEDAVIERRSLFEVLGIPDTGASRRGSTYYKKLFTCPRDFAFTYVLGFEPIYLGEALTVGLIFHVVMDTYYSEIQAHQQCSERPKRPYSAATRVAWENYWWGNASHAMHKSMAALDPLTNEPGYKDTWAVIERITGHYFDTNWKTDRWEILAVEEGLEYVDEDFEYTARLDLLVRDWARNGGLWIVEQKTARYLTQDLIDNYQQDLQILGQNFLVQNCLDFTHYPALQGTFVNITTKQVTPKSDRIESSPSRRHIQAFVDSVTAWSRVIELYEELGWPKALGKCAGAPRGYSRCEFYDICHDHPSTTVEEFAKHEPPIGFRRKGTSE
jgi:hypothetical protein